MWAITGGRTITGALTCSPLLFLYLGRKRGGDGLKDSIVTLHTSGEVSKFNHYALPNLQCVLNTYLQSLEHSPQFSQPVHPSDLSFGPGSSLPPRLPEKDAFEARDLLLDDRDPPLD